MGQNKGIALVTTIIFVAAILIISGAMLYLITRGVRSSGEFQRFETVQAASEGGMEIAIFVLENIDAIFSELCPPEAQDICKNMSTVSLEAGRIIFNKRYNDKINFNRLEKCAISNDVISTAGAYLDRYLIGMSPDDPHYKECQEQTMEKPFITITPKRDKDYDPPYDQIDIYIRKDYHGPLEGAGDSPSLTALSQEASAGLPTGKYLIFIRSFATHHNTHDNSTVELLYQLVK